MDSDHTDTEWPSALAKRRGRRRLSPVPDVRMRCDPTENLSETEKAPDPSYTLLTPEPEKASDR